MSLFIQQSIVANSVKKTPVTAQAIYNHLIEHKGNVTAVFTGGYKYPIKWIQQVYAHAKKKEKEIIQYVKENPTCSISSVKNNVTSEWLDITILGADVIHYNPTFDKSRTFNQFKTAITQTNE